MANFLAILRLFAALLPIITECVKQVESAFPESGQGSAKLELVKVMLQGAYEKLSDVNVAFETLWPTVQNMVATVVTIYNTIGLFKTNPK